MTQRRETLGPDIGDLPLAGALVAERFEGWPQAVLEDFEGNASNGRVGGRLLAETDRVRVWDIHLEPGERLGAHRHVLDYFWTALLPGRSRQHSHDGSTREVSYAAGETRSFRFARDQFLLHDLENAGDTAIAFITVEFLDGANDPLPLT